METDIERERIAVIGLSGRFPGAQNSDEFWANLVSGKESISFFSEEELIESGIYENLVRQKNYVKARGVIGDTEYFDAPFFGYTPREAELLDPQHRIFLECCWEALEDAGYSSRNDAYRIGTYGGTGTPWYLTAIYKQGGANFFANGVGIIIGNDKDYLTTKVSYKMHLTGTSFAIQCACSTSLVAIVQGMYSLLNYRNDMVLAGGVSINFPEKHGYLYEQGGLDSPDGHCRAFDAKAEGTVFSSGAGVVVLKRLSDAIRDRDHIYCTILGGAVNNDGISKMSFTAPGSKGQTEVEIESLEMAGINPETISYVEAHGTGTSLGDPLEVRALADAFSEYTDKKQFCAIGSVKTNIGHTDTASGVIGLIKMALAYKHGFLPPSLHFDVPNPEIDFKNSPFKVQSKLTRWERTEDIPLRSIVNSFGIGGTNACVVLEEAPQVTDEKSAEDGPYFLTLSAKTQTALETMTQRLQSYLIRHPSISLRNVCYTLQVGRKTFEDRKVIIFKDRHELEDLSTGNIIQGKEQQGVKCVFMFPGQGNQYFNMGRELFERYVDFRTTVNACDEILQRIGFSASLVYYLYERQEEIVQTDIAQVALFVIEYALAKLLETWGVLPDVMIGHSVGEYVAATLSGIFSLEDALKVVMLRGQLIQNLPVGNMMAVFAAEQEVYDFLPSCLEIAAINAPKLCIVSGKKHDLTAWEPQLTQRNIAFKLLTTSHAFHSYMIEPVVEPMFEILQSIPLAKPKIPMISTVTGVQLSAEEAINPRYWAEHARRPVLFSQAVRYVVDNTENIFLEVGPGHSLESAVKNHAKEGVHIIGFMRSSFEKYQDTTVLLQALGKLWVKGVPILWEKYYTNPLPKRVSLPTYPFERKKYVIDIASGSTTFSGGILRENKKQPLNNWFYYPSWKRSMNVEPTYFQKDGRCWILFLDATGLGEKIRAFLQKLDQTVVVVNRNRDKFTQFELNVAMDPRKEEHYDFLFSWIRQQSFSEVAVLHLWNVTSSDQETLSEEAEEQSFYNVLLLEKAITRAQLGDNLYLTFVANGLFDLIGKEELNPLKNLIIGPARVYKSEYPKSNIKVIDIEASQSDGLILQLLAESTGKSEDIVIAYRNASRWIPVYTSIPIHHETKTLLKKNGVYLITGGLGGLGLVTLQAIAEKNASRVYLLHRSPFPEREMWEDWLKTHPSENEISKKIRLLMAVESQGTTVFLVQGDVANLEQIQQLYRTIVERDDILHGIFHCAGVAGGGVISLKTGEMASKTLNPKVTGTLVLYETFKSMPLDFLILYSSITSILGDKGQVDYCSANAFLDAFAHAVSLSRGVHTVSVNWGRWGGVGMAINHKKMVPDEIDTLPSLSPAIVNKVHVDGREILVYELNPDQAWFIKHHRLKGIPTLVGTTFFHFLFDYAKEMNYVLRVENMQFVTPIMFPTSQPKKLKCIITGRESKRTFVFKTVLQGSGSHEEGQEHLRGMVELLNQSAVSEKLDIRQLQRILVEDKYLEKKRRIEREQMRSILSLGRRWNEVSHVYYGKGAWLAKIKLPDEYSGDISVFPIHPALLDLATTFNISYITDRLYLPLGYRQVTIYGPLPRVIFSYVTLDESSITDDTISLNIVIADEEGNVLMNIEGYYLKRLEDGQKDNYLQAGLEGGYHEEDDILPDDGKEAILHILEPLPLHQVVVCTTDFNKKILDQLPSNKPEKKNETVGKYDRGEMSTSYQAPTNEIEKMVVEIWQSIFGISPIGISDHFVELGGHSLTAVQVTAQINDLFKIALTVEDFLKSPTIQNIADLIAERLLSSLDEEVSEEILKDLEGVEK